MKVDPKLLAPCGLYCGVCAVLYATRDNNPKFKERLLEFYKGKLPGSENLTSEDIRCEGCLSQAPFVYCRECPIKDCTRDRGYRGCHECNDFPCRFVEEFPLPLGKKVIFRTIPHWREVGTEKCIQEEEARYICPKCGHRLFRGARRCNECGGTVDLDG
jgi:hypothetical protein